MLRPKPIPQKAGQESVWDYPRPPCIEPVSLRIEIDFGNVRLADTTGAMRVLETSHPPVYYIPPKDIAMEHLQPTEHGSYCEWKGRAVYYTVQVGVHVAENAAWAYPDPTPAFTELRNYLAFYPALMSECRVDGEIVEPQPGGFYGGWITSNIVGPFKGEPGSWGW